MEAEEAADEPAAAEPPEAEPDATPADGAHAPTHLMADAPADAPEAEPAETAAEGAEAAAPEAAPEETAIPEAAPEEAAAPEAAPEEATAPEAAPEEAAAPEAAPEEAAAPEAAPEEAAAPEVAPATTEEEAAAVESAEEPAPEPREASAATPSLPDLANHEAPAEAAAKEPDTFAASGGSLPSVAPTGRSPPERVRLPMSTGTGVGSPPRLKSMTADEMAALQIKHDRGQVLNDEEMAVLNQLAEDQAALLTWSMTSTMSRHPDELPVIPLPDLRAAQASEKAMMTRVTDLRRQLQKERTRYSVKRAYHTRQVQIATYRKELDSLTGKDVREQYKKTMASERAPEEAMLEVSRYLNASLVKVFAEPLKRSWYNLFLSLDSDRTGKVTYDELAGFVRKRMKLTQQELPDAKLLSVWAAMDKDDKGFITSGEFGHFMRLASRKSGKTWKEKYAAAQQERGRASRREAAVHAGRDIIERLGNLPRADKRTMEAVSIILNSNLTIFAIPEQRTWYKLFKHIDDNDTGRIDYREFKEFVREELGVDYVKLPEDTFNSVWKTLDDDGSGYITVAEFGPFIALGAKANKNKAWEKTPQQIYQEKFERAQKRREHENALSAQVVMRRISDRTDHLQHEVHQLSRALNQTQRAKTRLADLRRPTTSFRSLAATASAPTLPMLEVEARPTTSHSISLGRGRGNGEFNIDKNVDK